MSGQQQFTLLFVREFFLPMHTSRHIIIIAVIMMKCQEIMSDRDVREIIKYIRPGSFYWISLIDVYLPLNL